MKKIIIILFIFLIGALWIWQALAIPQGANSPAAAVNDSSFGTVAWSDPTNVFGSDDQRANVSLRQGSNSYYLKATDFRFSIPPNSTIDGILVEVERRVTGWRAWARDAEVRIVKRGIIGRDNKADRNTNWPASDIYKSYGDSNNLWEETWEVADINSDDFGVVIAVQGGGPLRLSAQASINHIRITVYYTLPLGPANWREDFDTPTSGVIKGDNIRLRIEIANTGSEAIDFDYRLQYAQKNGDFCRDEEFTNVPVSAANKDFQMSTSAYVNNGQDTTAQFPNDEGYTFVTGKIVTDPSNSSGNITLPFESYTEIEFVFQATNNALDGQSYCFRLANAGAALDNYLVYPELQIAIPGL